MKDWRGRSRRIRRKKQEAAELREERREAARLTSETKLPTFVSEEGEKEFEEGLVEAYLGTLSEVVEAGHRLSRKAQ